MQSLFLIYGSNYRTKKQNEEIERATSGTKGTNKSSGNSRTTLLEAARKRQEERGEI